MDPDADMAMLEALEGEIGRGCGWGANAVKPVMEVLEDTLSNAVQMTESKACLAENCPAEMERLMRMYVEP